MLVRKNPEGFECEVLDVEGYPERLEVSWKKQGEDVRFAYADLFIGGRARRTILSKLRMAARDILESQSERDGYMDGSEIEQAVHQTAKFYAKPLDLLENSEIAYLNHILVFDPFQRGTGVGSAMLKEVEEGLRSDGISVIYLVAGPAERAFWYLRQGYEVVYPFDRDLFQVVYPLLKKDI